MQALPEDDLELMKLLSAGMNQAEIAAMFHVSVAAVSKRLLKMNIVTKGAESPVTSALPWDVPNHPEKGRLVQQSAFRGLRSFLRKRLGETLTARAEKERASFLKAVRGGSVLALVEGQGFVYVPRQDSDADLVVRWPEGTPKHDRVSLFVDSSEQS